MTSAWSALLETECAGRGAVSLALRRHPDAPFERAWLPDTDVEPIFLAYSITKTYTAALVLQLVDEARFALDAPLSRWRTDIDRAAQITIRQLLAHTAGIPDYGPLPVYHEAVRTSPRIPWQPADYAAHTIEKGLEFEPGTRFAYSNPGYMLLSQIACEETSRSYRELVSERIAGPLGLERTFVPESIADLAGLAAATSTLLDPAGTPRDVRDTYHPGWVSHGVVAAPPSEVLAFYEALFGGQVISQASLAEMTTLRPIGHLGPGYGEPSYGLGLMADPKSPHGPMLGHNGGGPGYATSAFRFPEGVTAGERGRPVMIVVMASVEADDFAEGLVRAVARQIASDGVGG